MYILTSTHVRCTARSTNNKHRVAVVGTRKKPSLDERISLCTEEARDEEEEEVEEEEVEEELEVEEEKSFLNRLTNITTGIELASYSQPASLETEKKERKNCG